MKKLLSIILAILMIVTTIPMAFAAEEMTVLTEFCIYEDDYNYPGGWSNDNEENYHLGIQDEGKIAWEEGDELLIIFNEYDTDTWKKINTQTALLRYENEQFNGSISFVYDENSYIETYGCIGKGGGTDEYINIYCKIIDNVLYIVFPDSRVHYSRLRIVGEANTSYDVTVDGFFTADNFEKLITQNYTLTTDNNGNAYLYGIFIEGAILSVNGVSCTFDPPEPTISEKSYAVCAVHNFSDGYCTECYVKCAHANCSNSVCNDCGYICLHSDTIVQVDAKAPTCTQVGNEAYEYCTECDYTTYVELPADPDAHTSLEAVTENEVAPKCGVAGSYDLVVYCACGEELDRDTVAVDALIHSFTKYEVTEEAKCGVAGKEVAACDRGCGATDEKAVEALIHKDDDNDSLCDYGCGTELVVLDGEMFIVNGDITNTGIYIGAFDAFNDCYKAGDGYITIIGEGNNDTVITLYDATIDVRGTETTEAIRISGEDVEIRFFGENNIFADEEAISNAIGSVDHSNVFVGEENAVLNLYGNISACEVTVESGTINIYGSDEKGEIIAVYIEKQLVVSENAVVNIISGDSGIGLNVGILAQKGIIAEGELNAITLNGTATDDELIYNLIAIGDAVLGADTYSPYYGMEIPEDMNVEVNFIVPEGASVTVPEGITLNLDSMTNVDIDGELIVYGTLICTHTGGENTCDAPAVCDICGTEYGNIDADNHKDTLVQVDAKAPTCTEIGWDAYEYCTACDYTTKVEIPANGHTALEAIKENEVTPECGKTGSYDLVVYCACGEELGREIVAVDALTHTDTDGDYKCDNGCGHEFEKPAPEEPTDKACDHLCHKGGFMGFIWKIVKFFSKLFKINPVCECGAAHY